MKMVGLLGQWCNRIMTRYPTIAALGGYLLLAALFYLPILLGVRTFPDGDFTHHFLPFSLFQQAALQAGQAPVWNPYTYAGHPFLADTQAAVFYPVSNLWLLLTWAWNDAGARLYWLQAEAALHVALAGFFVYLLTRDLTGNRWAAFVGGSCFAFSGYLTGYPPLQLAVLRTAIWLPLLLWLLHRAFTQPTQWRWWLGAGAATASAVFAGHPQTLLHIGYTAAAFVMVRLMQVGLRVGLASLWQPWLGLITVIFVALGLSAAQLLPSLEFAAASVRANVDYSFVSGGFPLQDTWQLLLPGVLTQFSPLYIGVVGLGLTLLALPTLPATEPVTHRPLRWFFLGLALIGLLVAYGENGFLYRLLYAGAPGWNLFRGQERAALLVALGLSVLAAYGAAAIPALALRTRQWLALFYMGLVAAGVYAFGLLWQLMGHTAIGQGRYLVIAFVTLVLAAALVVPLRLPGWSRHRSTLVAALLLLNLFGTNMGANLAEFGPADKTMWPPEMAALADAVHARDSANLGLPSRTYNEFRVYENYGMRIGVEDVWGSSPLRLARYARLFDQFPLDRLWRLTGVEHLLTWRRDLFVPSSLLAEFPQAADTTFLHRLAESNPRAWLVTHVLPADDDEAVAQLADHNLNLDETAFVPSETLAETQGAPGAGMAQIRLARPAHNRLHVALTSNTGGLLVISENWLPGWEITECRVGIAACEMSVPVLGLRPFSIVRANLTLIGVPIPAGEVQFELRYWPNSLQSGLWISGGTMALLFMAALWRTMRRRRSP